MTPLALAYLVECGDANEYYVALYQQRASVSVGSSPVATDTTKFELHEELLWFRAAFDIFRVLINSDRRILA